MKALITAGGRGSRLRPITNTINKHLVPICNKPILFQAIENVRAVGIRDIIININADDAELPAIVGDGSAWGATITYVRQEAPLGLGHVIRLAEPLIGTESFVLYYGDNVLAGGLSSHLETFLTHGSNCHLCVVRVTNPSQFGVAVTEGNRVIQTVEKPSTFVSDLAITGVQFYDSTIFEAIKHIQPTPPIPPRTIAEMDIPPANQWMIDRGLKVTYSEITGWWKDTGRPKDLIAASELLLDQIQTSMAGNIDAATTTEGKVVIDAGAVIKHSRLVGPVMIGVDAVITDSTVGPYVSVGKSSTILDSKIDHSLVMDGVTIAHMPTICESIIGHAAQLFGERGERSNRFILGEHTNVRIAT